MSSPRVLFEVVAAADRSARVLRMNNCDSSDWNGIILFYKGNMSDRDSVPGYSRKSKILQRVEIA